MIFSIFNNYVSFQFEYSMCIPCSTANESRKEPSGSFLEHWKNKPRKIKEQGLIQSRGVGLRKGCELGDVGSSSKTC